MTCAPSLAATSASPGTPLKLRAACARATDLSSLIVNVWVVFCAVASLSLTLALIVHSPAAK